jgi:hypothetical protein
MSDLNDWLIAGASLAGVLLIYEALKAAAKHAWRTYKHRRRRKRGIYE